MAKLINLTENETEDFLAKLVNTATIQVRIDRPSGIINFVQKKPSSEVLNEWSANINSLMALVNNTCHLIIKEECINQCHLIS